jgi:hypothetical protein
VEFETDEAGGGGRERRNASNSARVERDMEGIGMKSGQRNPE